jgi:hypothetical protein
MKLLLEGSLVALVLMCALVSVVALGRHTVATETYPPAAGSFTIVVASDDGGGETYRWVEWDGSSSSSSCNGVVWEAQRADPSSSESEGGGGDIIGEAKEDCRGVHIRPHLATSRQPGVRPSTDRHRAQPTTSEYSSSRGAPRGHKLPLRKDATR